MTVSVVDGNALAGAFATWMLGDATSIEAECRSCGSSAPLATTIVERDGYADIVRCRGCTHTLLTVLHESDGDRVVFGSLQSWVLPIRR